MFKLRIVYFIIRCRSMEETANGANAEAVRSSKLTLRYLKYSVSPSFFTNSDTWTELIWGTQKIPERHEWSAAPISAYLRRGPRGYFRSKCCIGGESVAAQRVNCFLAPIHQHRATRLYSPEALLQVFGIGFETRAQPSVAFTGGVEECLPAITNRIYSIASRTKWC